MSYEKLPPPCGLYCGTCEYFGKQCQGCGDVKGKPFWTNQMKVETCPLYDCCINNKGLEHCGSCDELPCKTFNNFYDPSLSEEEARKSILARQKDLVRRKEIGTGKWLKEKAKVNTELGR